VRAFLHLPADGPGVAERVAGRRPDRENAASVGIVAAKQVSPRVPVAQLAAPPLCLGELHCRLDILIRVPRTRHHRPLRQRGIPGKPSRSTDIQAVWRKCKSTMGRCLLLGVTRSVTRNVISLVDKSYKPRLKHNNSYYNHQIVGLAMSHRRCGPQAGARDRSEDRVHADPL
jgi:hypothetical protein